MAVTVVDELEVIDVYEQRSDLLAGASFKLGSKFALECISVVQL